MEIMMNSQEDIMNALKEEIKQYEGCSLEFREVNRDDGVRMGVTLRKTGLNAGPTMYIDDDIDDDNVEKYVKEMIDTLVQYLPEKSVDLSYLQDYENVKPNLFISAYSVTSPYLRDKRWLPSEYEGIAMLPKVHIGKTPAGEGSIAVNEALLQMWDKDLETVVEDAIANSPEMMPMVQKNMGVPLDVRSNKELLGGSAVILYPDFKSEMEEVYPNGFYIIPSSRHEVIIFPAEFVEAMSEDYVTSMIKEVNRSMIVPEDYLSDYAYKVVGDEVTAVKGA